MMMILLSIVTLVVIANVAWLSRRRLPWLFRPKAGFGIIENPRDLNSPRHRCLPPDSWVEEDGDFSSSIKYVLRLGRKDAHVIGTKWRCECGKAWRLRRGAGAGLHRWYRAPFSDTESATRDVVKLAKRIVRENEA